MKIGSNATTAVHLWAGRFCVPLHDIADKERPLSTGVLILISNRLFVATAAHCIPIEPQGKLWVMDDELRRAEDGMLGFVNYGRDHSLDLGFLELNKADADAYLKFKSYLPLDKIRPTGPEERHSIATLLGYPAERASFKEHDQGTSVLIASLEAFTTSPLLPAEWKTPEQAESPATPESNIVIDYPETVFCDRTKTHIPAYHPRGYSGGGIWDHGHPAELIWAPETHATLTGLQSHWYENSRQLVAVRIIHWLRLVHTHYPELRETLEAQFPELKD